MGFVTVIVTIILVLATSLVYCATKLSIANTEIKLLLKGEKKMNQHLERLDTVNPVVKQKFLEAEAEIKALGITILVVFGYRSSEEQAKLYRQGRTGAQIQEGKNKLIRLGRKDLADLIDKVGPQSGDKIVTNALPGQSIHEYKCAIDYVPLNSKGECDWNNENAYAKCSEVFKKHGFNCGFYWTSFHDNPHVEYANGLGWRDFFAGKKPDFMMA